MLRLVLPKGSLEKATLELFEAADLPVVRSSSVDYRASIDDPRIAEVRILRPQEIPTYVAEGLFDVGITGRDWVDETASDVVGLGELRYSKATSLPIRVVVAVAGDSDVQRVEDLPHGLRVSTEYPELTRRFFESKGITADIRLSYGASEAKIPDIADCIVDITETGRALRAAGLRIIDEIMQSYTEVIANRRSYDDPVKRHAMGQLMTLLNGTLDARGKVLVKMNVGADRLDDVLALVPAMKAPTVNPLAGGEGFAVETVVAKTQINRLIPALVEAGATGILELPDLEDHPVSTHRGAVVAFDRAAGLGTLRDDTGREWPFHCIEIADGTRDIEVGAAVTFGLLPKLGRYEAAQVTRAES